MKHFNKTGTKRKIKSDRVRMDTNITMADRNRYLNTFAKQFKCPDCGKGFYELFQMADHFKTVHGKELTR